MAVKRGLGRGLGKGLDAMIPNRLDEKGKEQLRVRMKENPAGDTEADKKTVEKDIVDNSKDGIQKGKNQETGLKEAEIEEGKYLEAGMKEAGNLIGGNQEAEMKEGKNKEVEGKEAEIRKGEVQKIEKLESEAHAAEGQMTKNKKVETYSDEAQAEKAKNVSKGSSSGKTVIKKDVIIEKKYEPMEVPINDIDPNKLQPRKSFDEDSLMELAESMKQVGVIQPLIVQKSGDRFAIIAGERRWRAARLAGLKTVPAVIKEYSPQETFEIAMIENLQREDLNPIEEAMAYQRLIKEYGLKQDEAAEKVGKSRVAVTNVLRLLKLDKRVQQMLIDDMLSEGHARAILAIEDPEKQFVTATKVFDEKLSVRETEKLVKKLLEEKPVTVNEEKTPEDSYVYQEIEEYMKRVMGTKVEIKRKANQKGKIEIEYYSNDELERIMDLFKKLEQ